MGLHSSMLLFLTLPPIVVAVEVVLKPFELRDRCVVLQDRCSRRKRAKTTKTPANRLQVEPSGVPNPSLESFLSLPTS
jgi:hypothetical protein